jgi:hypothetical protein
MEKKGKNGGKYVGIKREKMRKLKRERKKKARNGQI